MGNSAGATVDGSPGPSAHRPPLPDGLIAVVKRDCPTCELVVPVLEQLAEAGPLTVYTQDDPAFPESVAATDDTRLAFSWHHDIETVPTLILARDGKEEDRTVGWSRPHWEKLTGVDDLGPDLPEFRPGCGSLSVDPSLTSELAVRFGGSVLQSRRVELARLEDPFEAAFDRGWTDGLPVVPPTEARVMAMLEGTSRAADDVVAEIPPDLHEATVEQIAINAVMAGCRPEYLPVVLAAVEAACTQEFNMHGLLATTFFSGPILVVNGPIAKRLGMNSGGNAFGQGNRANMTIGRALQLVVRNLGGGRPGEVDMAMLGSPGKLSFCFAEREHDSPFSSLAAERGFGPYADTVTVFAGSGPTAIIDQISRTPESLVRSLAACLRSTGHPKLAMGFDAMLVVSPEHGRIFAQAGWDKDRLRAELDELLTMSGAEMVRGVDGIEEGLPEAFADEQVPKFRPGGLQIVHAGGDAGLFSAVLDGWVGGNIGSVPVTVEIRP
ncbi:MAG: thioredoxin family protein [Acidimicrobiia bacterium]|nr:thioredoxin family protein [Acidimicrobiia bacterium]